MRSHQKSFIGGDARVCSETIGRGPYPGSAGSRANPRCLKTFTDGKEAHGIHSSARQQRLKVAIIDENEDARWFLQRVLERSSEFRCVGCYASAEDAISQVPRIGPEIVLMEILLPGISGIECTRLLKGMLPGLVAVLMSGIVDLKTMLEARQAGADSYLTKPFSTFQCLAELRFAVARGDSDTEDSSALNLPSARGAREYRRLTQRENEVMPWLAKGLLYKEIAERLAISTSTVHYHLHSIFQKLRVGNRTEAVNRWRELNRT